MAWNGSNTINKATADKKTADLGSVAKTNVKTVGTRRLPTLYLILSGLLFLSFVAIFLFYGSDNTQDYRHKKRSQIADATPSIDDSVRKQNEESGEDGIVKNKVSNSVEVAKTPEEIEAEERRKDPLYDRHHIVAKMPVIGDSTEQLMVSIFETELGDIPPMIPVIPQVDEQKVMAAINKMHVAEAGDSEETKNAKDLVNLVKKELKKYLDDGGDVNSFLQYYCGQLQSAFEERNLCKETMSRVLNTEDREIAQEMYVKLTERLQGKGIKPFTLNRRQREYLGIIENTRGDGQ